LEPKIEKNKTYEIKNNKLKPLWETDPAQHEMNQFIGFYKNKRID
jgi:hypothetical protein